MPTIDANGLTVAYEMAGAGPPLIMLHGATGSGGSHMGGLMVSLAGTLRSYAPDARGHAGTRLEPDGRLTTDDLVADVLTFADALGLDTYHLLGYSLGGMTALTLATRHGDRLRSLVVLSIATEREPRLSVGRALLDPARIQRDEPDWVSDLAARHDPIQGAGGWQRVMQAIVRDVAEQPVLTPGELRGVAVPTLVAAGDRDPFVPVDHATRLARQVRAGRLCILPGMDHDLLDDRDPVLPVALAAFYASIDLGPDQEETR